MKSIIKFYRQTAIILLGSLLSNINAQTPDPNFHIYLCFGQSNMEGQGIIEAQDQNVNSRFQVMGALTCSPGKKAYTLGQWSTATPPIFRCNTNLSPADYFGRTLVDSLPINVRVGIVPVAVSGCDIALFDKANYATYVPTAPTWMQSIINEYGGNPYGRLVEVAKLAQKDGVIKGILMHQGETNTGQSTWPAKVKEVYDNLIADLGLDPLNTPLLVGEVVSTPTACCASHNAVIATIPNVIPNSYVISSAGLDAVADNAHFTSASYRTLGQRYAQKMLTLLPATDNTNGVATPSSIFNNIANNVTFSVVAKPNVTSVKIDLTLVGGTKNVMMSAIGNNEYTLDYSVAAGASTGLKYLPITLFDNTGDSSSGLIPLTINPTLSYLDIYTDASTMVCGGCTWSGGGTLTEQSNAGAIEGVKDYNFPYTLTDWWAGVGLNIANWSSAQAKDFSGYDSIRISYKGPIGNGTSVLISLKDGLDVQAPNITLPLSSNYTTASIALSSFANIDLSKIVEVDISVGGEQTGTGTLRFDNIRLVKANIVASTHDATIGSTELLKIYPNPSNGYVFIKNINTAFPLEIYDSKGRLTISKSLEKSEDQINIQILQKGMYVIKNHNNAQKLIIE